MIKERNASGLTINDYCKQKGISRNAYYYWLRRVRSEVLADSGFVEVPKPEIVQEHPSVSGQTITIKTGHLQISLPLSIPKGRLGYEAAGFSGRCMVYHLQQHNCKYKII